MVPREPFFLKLWFRKINETIQAHRKKTWAARAAQKKLSRHHPHVARRMREGCSLWAVGSLPRTETEVQR